MSTKNDDIPLDMQQRLNLAGFAGWTAAILAIMVPVTIETLLGDLDRTVFAAWFAILGLCSAAAYTVLIWWRQEIAREMTKQAAATRREAERMASLPPVPETQDYRTYAEERSVERRDAARRGQR